MSGLCRHNESYEHKDASRHAEKVIRSQMFTNTGSHLFWGNTQLLNMPRFYQRKWYPIEKANTQLIKKAWVFTQLSWKLICFTGLMPKNIIDCTIISENQPKQVMYWYFVVCNNSNIVCLLREYINFLLFKK